MRAQLRLVEVKKNFHRHNTECAWLVVSLSTEGLNSSLAASRQAAGHISRRKLRISLGKPHRAHRLQSQRSLPNLHLAYPLLIADIDASYHPISYSEVLQRNSWSEMGRGSFGQAVHGSEFSVLVNFKRDMHHAQAGWRHDR